MSRKSLIRAAKQVHRVITFDERCEIMDERKDLVPGANPKLDEAYELFRESLVIGNRAKIQEANKYLKKMKRKRHATSMV